jgi:hypothetical protein
MKIIKTKNGEEILVDDEDYDLVNEYTWCLINKGYARTRIGKRTTQLMHRMILDVTDQKVFVDHINGKPTDNRRENLRLCTQAENARNRGANKNNTSGVKRLHYDKRHNTWQAIIMLNGKIHTKSFSCNKYPNSKDLAINWLKDNREKLHGDFAKH